MFSFLKICPVATSAAMGETSVMTLSASAWQNPAVLPWGGCRELTAAHVVYLQDIGFSYMQYAHPLDVNTAIACSVRYLGVAGLTRTVADGSTAGYAEQGSFDSYDAALSLSLGKRLTRTFSYGGTLSGARQSIDTTTDEGVLVSLGGFYRPSGVDWQAGFGIVNAGPAVKGYDMPTGLFASIGTGLRRHLYVAGELLGYIDQEILLKTGLEYEINHTVFLRAGYRHPLRGRGLGDFPNVNLTAGMGCVLDAVTVDYAWVPYGDLGSTHRLSLSWAVGDPLFKKRSTEKRR